MKIWTFINGWQKTSYKQVKAALVLILGLVLNMSYASDQQRVTGDENIPSLELLEFLGNFEQQDETWFDNEMNKATTETVEPIIEDKVNE